MDLIGSVHLLIDFSQRLACRSILAMEEALCEVPQNAAVGPARTASSSLASFKIGGCGLLDRLQVREATGMSCVIERACDLGRKDHRVAPHWSKPSAARLSRGPGSTGIVRELTALAAGDDAIWR
jgi:hypothetical protein